jgi:hypothetical protein
MALHAEVMGQRYESRRLARIYEFSQALCFCRYSKGSMSVEPSIGRNLRDGKAQEYIPLQRNELRLGEHNVDQPSPSLLPRYNRLVITPRSAR